jgi:subtilisin family serine protease
LTSLPLSSTCARATRALVTAALLLNLPAPSIANLPADRLVVDGGEPQRPRRVPRPNRRSLEYRLSWGVGAINADSAYAKGATGSGVIVAMIDTGLGGTPAALFTHVSPDSVDLAPNRKANDQRADHGQQTASLLASSLDGSGTVGVAYGATLLSIRADMDGSCAMQCSVRARDLARGIDYALSKGAKVIGVPLVGGRPLPAIEPALARAATAGAIIVAAAGNDAAIEPSWPARYAADPRFSGSIIVAGASTYSGALARWSSRASAAQRRYIAAPGENILVDCGKKYCKLVSGTSYSVSYVAGALSLLLERYPRLSPSEAANILLESAQDSERPGVDALSGRGLLDVRRAMRRAEKLGKNAAAS